ncbi:MAG: biotin synthase BioB, partial [Butyrivibrio sp.]|nr:biotin synthase BioB [Butyrivibrio sp.]
MTVNELKEKVLNGSTITKEEALFLINEDIEEVACAADEIRKKYNGNSFDMCAIMSVKGGRCSENCKFCAQSSCSSAEIPE